jgi:pimeloyl-ACP methyl ester carboxylesterase
MARYVPVNLTEMQQAAESREPNFADPSVLERVSAPVLLLRGSETEGRWAAESVRYLAGHLPDARVHEVAGAAHFGPLLVPEPVAKEITGFLALARQQA